MTDATLRKLFETSRLPASRFDHETHVRMAWKYLSDDGFEDGSAAFIRDLKAYAASLEVPQKYHETITRFFLIVMDQRMADGDAKDWSAFRDAHPDLVESASSLLNRHYSRERLRSDEARTAYLPPDLEAL